MPHETAFEEGVGAMPRPIDELVGNHGVAGRELLAQAAAGGGREQRVAAQHLEPADVRPVVDLGRRDAMAPSVPRQEGDGDAPRASR